MYRLPALELHMYLHALMAAVGGDGRISGLLQGVYFSSFSMPHALYLTCLTCTGASPPPFSLVEFGPADEEGVKLHVCHGKPDGVQPVSRKSFKMEPARDPPLLRL